MCKLSDHCPAMLASGQAFIAVTAQHRSADVVHFARPLHPAVGTCVSLTLPPCFQCQTNYTKTRRFWPPIQFLHRGLPRLCRMTSESGQGLQPSRRGLAFLAHNLELGRPFVYLKPFLSWAFGWAHEVLLSYLFSNSKAGSFLSGLGAEFTG